MELLIVFNSVYSWVTCLSLSTSLITLILWSLSKTTKKPKEPGDHVPFTGDLEIGQSFHNDQVLVFPGRTSHTRLFPKAHSFSYGFLITVVPVRNCKSNWFAAIDNENKPWWRRGWLRVDPPDHLHRGDDDHGLSYKLDRYLESKKYDPARYPTVWLVTSPRFLGYKSDQASFWYLYTADGRLDTMIIEANNNFAERKVWIVPAEEDNNTSSNTTTKKQRKKFHQAWPKEFHVSPFNSRCGFYSISTLDSFPPENSLDEAGTIDITITLLTSQWRPKLVARVWSTSKPLVPSKVSAVYGFAFLASWGLTGPLLQPRTLFQAFRMFRKYKLKIRDRPEPDGKVFPRHATPAERCIREVFTEHLRQIMNASTKKFHLHLHDLTDGSSTKMTFSTSTANQESPCYNISILTPRFYAIALACPYIDTFLHEALLHKSEDRRTARTDATNPEAFIQLLKHAADSPCRTSGNTDSTPKTSNTSIKDPKTWIPKTWKLTISLLLLWIWGCVTVMRAIFQLRLSGGGPGSFIGSTKRQINDNSFFHCNSFKQAKTSKNLDCYLDHYVHQHYGPGLTLRYLFANLTTLVRERVLSVVGGG